MAAAADLEPLEVLVLDLDDFEDLEEGFAREACLEVVAAGSPFVELFGEEESLARLKLRPGS